MFYEFAPKYSGLEINKFGRYLNQLYFWAMFKKGLALFLICAIATQHLQKVVAYFSFKANQEYIAVAICSNQNKPELNCLGACFLDKQLKAIDQSQESTKNLASQTSKKQEQPVFVENTLEISVPVLIARRTYNPYVELYQPVHADDFFRPPQKFLI